MSRGRAADHRKGALCVPRWLRPLSGKCSGRPHAEMKEDEMTQAYTIHIRAISLMDDDG